MSNGASDVNTFAKGIREPRRARVVLTEAALGPLDEFEFPESDFDYDFEEGQLTGLHRPIFLVRSGDEDINGSFISGRVSKLGGINDKTTVILVIDERTVIKMSFKKAVRLGLKDRNNPFGVVFHKGTKRVGSLTFGFPQPLFFQSRLELFVKVNERNVDSFEAEVIWASEVGIDGEPSGPGNGEAPFP